MLRTALLTISLVAVGAAQAASLNTIGSFTTVDLTQTLIATCTGAGCASSIAGGSFGATGAYMNTTFSSISNGVPTPSSSAQSVTTGANSTPFVLNNIAGGNDTFYTGNNTNSIVVDLNNCSGNVIGSVSNCGVFGIANIYTMIQANQENFSQGGISITLNGTDATDTQNVSETINLVAGADYRAVSNAMGNNANQVNCTVANSTGQNCAGETSDTASSSGFDSANQIEVYNNVFGPDVKTGSPNIDYYLDVQELELGNFFTNAYLNSITITNSTTGGSSRMEFSGLTLQSPTPEPGTIFLLSGGIALLGLAKFRSSRSSN